MNKNRYHHYMFMRAINVWMNLHNGMVEEHRSNAGRGGTLMDAML